MSRVTELEKALTTLFRKGTEVGYTETEIDEFLENIDYHALLQAVWNKAETVYAYRADGKNALSLDYRSAELFKQRATLLYEDVGDSYIGAVFAARSMELWLLEDMGFAVVAKFSVNAGEGEYVTEYRVYKGSDWADSEISLDLEDLVAELAALCDPYYEHEQPIYELRCGKGVKTERLPHAGNHSERKRQAVSRRQPVRWQGQYRHAAFDDRTRYAHRHGAVSGHRHGVPGNV